MSYEMPKGSLLFLPAEQGAVTITQAEGACLLVAVFDDQETAAIALEQIEPFLPGTTYQVTKPSERDQKFDRLLNFLDKMAKALYHSCSKEPGFQESIAQLEKVLSGIEEAAEVIDLDDEEDLEVSEGGE